MKILILINIGRSVCQNLHRPRKNQSLPGFLVRNKQVRCQWRSKDLELKGPLHFKELTLTIKRTVILKRRQKDCARWKVDENRNQSDVKVILSGGNGDVKLRTQMTKPQET